MSNQLLEPIKKALNTFIESNIKKNLNASPLKEADKSQTKDNDVSNIDSQRIFHGRGGYFPGLEWCCIDYFQPIFLITLFKEAPGNFVDEVATHIEKHTAQYIHLGDQQKTIVLQQSRFLPRSPIEAIAGQIPERAFARRRNLYFILSFAQQNVGYFLDMETGREWLEARANHKRVLNLFSYTCAFSVVAKEAGASTIVNVDMSKRALSTGRDNHRLNQHDLQGVQFLGLDILKSWSRIKKNGPYDIIIVDPPSYQKGSFIAERDYVKIIRRLKEFAAPGADILICLNDPKTSPQFLIDLVTVEAPYLLFEKRLPSHPDFPDISEDAALKLLAYRMPEVTKSV